jgi:hypothetical protein
MNSNPINDKEKVNVEQVKREIEKKTEKMVDLAYKTGRLVSPIDLITKKVDVKQTIEDNNSEQLLRNMMSSGANEFNEKVGRQMTYGEMREMWG